MAAYQAYAEYADVLARAGRVARVFGQAGAPGEGEIEEFLKDVAGLINTTVALHGLNVPVVDEDAAQALRGINADGALLIALGAALPAQGQDQAASDLKSETQARFSKAMDGLTDGSSSVVKLLITREIAGSEQAAGSLWTDEPLYDWTRGFEDLALGHSIRPAFNRGMRL